MTVVPHELWFISIPNLGPLLFPQAVMRTCHSVSWLLVGLACDFVCAHDEAQFGSSVINQVEDVVRGNVAEAGDLASVSLPLQSLGVPQSEGRETMKQI